MLRKLLFLLVFMLIASFTLAIFSSTALAEREGICDELTGAAYGLCVAYCQAMDCASDPQWQWSPVDPGDWQDCDVGNTTESSTPDPAWAAEGLIAICWDQSTWSNSAVTGPWCTYKDPSSSDPECTGNPGGLTGFQYMAVSVPGPSDTDACSKVLENYRRITGEDPPCLD